MRVTWPNVEYEQKENNNQNAARGIEQQTQAAAVAAVAIGINYWDPTAIRVAPRRVQRRWMVVVRRVEANITTGKTHTHAQTTQWSDHTGRAPFEQSINALLLLDK